MSASYSIVHYERIHRIEQTHFWFLARNILLQKLIRRFIPNSSNVSFLEIGFGTGVVIHLLERMGFRVTGIDVNKRALLYARRNTKATLLQQSIFSFCPKERFAAIGAFDVMEHQKRDLLFLKRVHKLLTPNGLLFLTIPAHRWLWSKLDILSDHKRRYSFGELKQKLEGSGFTVLFWNHWQVITLPIFWLWRQILLRKKKKMIESYLAQPQALVNRLLYLLLLFEQLPFFRVKFPVGGSLVVCAKRLAI